MVGILVTLAGLITDGGPACLARESALAGIWHAVLHPSLTRAVIAIDASRLVLFALADFRGVVSRSCRTD